jgi:hypothetical protein
MIVSEWRGECSLENDLMIKSSSSDGENEHLGLSVMKSKES